MKVPLALLVGLYGGWPFSLDTHRSFSYIEPTPKSFRNIGDRRVDIRSTGGSVKEDRL
jgi:hypothetical protein